MVEFLNENVLVTLFALIGLGLLLGRVEIKGISLGSSGVLFAAILFGHFGVEMPNVITTVGVALFVYAIGLQAGPRFFKTFRSRGLGFAILAIATLFAGLLAVVATNLLFQLGAPLSTGMYTGAMTSTPGLAAAMEAVDTEGWRSAVSVGYGVAYPFGVIGVVLFVQVLPRILKLDLQAIAKEESRSAARLKPQGAWFQLGNPQLAGMTVGEFLAQKFAQATVTRVERPDGTILPARSDLVLQSGDFLRFVFSPGEETKLETVIGPEIPDKSPPESQGGNIVSRDVFVTQDEMTGRTLRDLAVRERHGIVIARLWREEIEFIPQGDSKFEIGDLIRIVGTPEACDRFQALVGMRDKRLQETNFVPLCVGLTLGALLGLKSWSIPGTEFSFRLGMAGGPLFVALIVGHFGRIGRMSIRMPVATKIFIRELGLLFFLAGAGLVAGANFVDIIREQGLSLIFAGAIVTTFPMAVALVIARKVMKLDILSTLGAICGGMTSTPGLGAISQVSDSESPAVAYATVYPVALIVVTIFSQLLGRILFGMG